MNKSSFGYCLFVLLSGFEQPDDPSAFFAAKKFHNDVIERNTLHTNKSLCTEHRPCPPVAIALPSRVLRDPPAPHAPMIVVRPEPRPPRQPAPPRPSRAEPMEERASTPVQYCLPTARKDKSGKNVDTLMDVFVPPTRNELYKRVPQSKELTYKGEATFYNVLFVLVKNEWLAPSDEEMVDTLETLSGMNPEYEAIIEKVPKLMGVDFSSLLDERLDYADQTQIKKERVWLMMACAVYYDLDFGLVLRFLSGEYTASWRDVDAIMAAIDERVSPSDRDHIWRILTKGCPANLVWEEEAENKETFLRRGNNPSIKAHWKAVKKTLNKEERNHHIMPFERWMCRASPFGRHTPNTVIVKVGEKMRLIWDGTTKKFYWEVTMNDVTEMENEAVITFGYAFIGYITWIWRLRMTYPHEEILLAFVDISACFRFPRIFPDLCGAFGFVMGPWFFAANAMVFGSVASASSWEPFRRAIVALALAYFFCKGLVEKHQALLDLATWDPEPDDEVVFVQAQPCSKQRPIIDDDGNEEPSEHNTYVDDNMMADIRRRMPSALAAAAEAIFTIMGVPTLRLRQSAVAMDKWRLLVVSHSLILLGLLFNTRKMTVGVTEEYRKEVLDLLDKTWHPGREAFTVHEIELLVGKLGRIGQAYRPIYHLMPHMYGSVAYALRDNEAFLALYSRRYCKVIKAAKKAPGLKEDMREINFAIGQKAKMEHGEPLKHRMPESLKMEIALCTAVLRDETIELSTPFGHIADRDYEIEAGADSCKKAGGGWSIDLLFWWHLEYSAEVQRRARLPNNKCGTYISINVLEMVCVVINFAAVIYFCEVDGIDLSNHPLIHNWCDNTSACAWANSKCKNSMIGRALGRMFLGLLMSTKLGIQAKWLATELNKLADDISRLEDDDHNYDYSRLVFDHPCLANCRQFQPSNILLSMISEVLLNNASPDPLIIRKLAPLALGSHTSSSL